jgi:hypothetical protein
MIAYVPCGGVTMLAARSNVVVEKDRFPVLISLSVKEKNCG